MLVLLLNTYLVGKRLELRRLREESIPNTLQKQVIEQQSFIDPLTEIYNRRSLDEIVGARCVICRIAEHLAEWNRCSPCKEFNTRPEYRWC